MIVGKLRFTSIYFYFCSRVYVMNTPVYRSSTGLMSSTYFLSMGLLPTRTSILRVINIRGNDSITYLTAISSPLLPPDRIIQWISGILFFNSFLELLGSDLLQKYLISCVPNLIKLCLLHTSDMTSSLPGLFFWLVLISDLDNSLSCYLHLTPLT